MADAQTAMERLAALVPKALAEVKAAQVEVATARREAASPLGEGFKLGLAAAAKAVRSECEKCDGAGWLWGDELSVPPDRDRSYGTDDTRYSCDSDLCRLAESIGGLRAPERTETAAEAEGGSAGLDEGED
jgi:hypothetical protein